ncbi:MULTISPECIES: hypothetical protein [unclassified Novosphingobium]|uniref:hypothetical protein n=1 Tax=unclassified Novosphingobium TaxID=2644732 RepID=UPI00086BA5C0|nr:MULTISPECIES: hypothetical protein [unclassified Novosphingobium]MBN9144012.1 hypothetical protein [Novosphingobium sp.]MDR6709208.1 hypothetical protein [Novosphingobium sp. 1748]NKJ01714.1 hypothetical protein [Novosphingobium sp. SG707]ODU81755.1 MAG: hypothetical protein ABT10_12595 [Novosphingobium sp. SCN 63-17]OJX95142.1 MAG: hypothetical protein BGP00_09785 [Novosphingobium sp. 63-713]
MAQTDPRSPPDFKPRKRPKNREVENEMMGWVKSSGEPPHSATEPPAEEQDTDEAEDLREPKGTGAHNSE